jgi:catechol 2,3-dioxygenase-like lactoylglutathione lyase family enzyme
MIHLIEPPEGPGNDLVKFHVAFEVENFEETVEILRESKYEITIGPNTRYDGQKAIYIKDLDGNTIEFASHNNSKHSNRIVDAWGYTTNP